MYTAAAGASLLAITAVLASDAGARTEAQQALSSADSYIRAIRDENALQASNATLANLALLASLSHDATLTQYWQNATAGTALVRTKSQSYATDKMGKTVLEVKILWRPMTIKTAFLTGVKLVLRLYNLLFAGDKG